MSRRSVIRRFVGFALLASCALCTWRAPAQDDSAGRVRLDRQGLTRPDLRVGPGGQLATEAIDPRLETILQEWSDHAVKIKKVQGRHLRTTLDLTFQIESIAEGRFYVELPGKGRIDSGPCKAVKPGAKETRRLPDGRMMEFVVQADNTSERWICDGTELKKIDDDKKTCEILKIPPANQGANLMDGPLPFLFGLPPEKAKARYRFILLKDRDQNNLCYLQIFPKLQQDAADWKRADVVLDRTTYLPRKVFLDDPAGTKRTMYSFSQIEIDKINIAFWNNPFNPLDIRWYKREVRNPQQVAANAAPKNGKHLPLGKGVPSLVGLYYKDADNVLKELKVETKLIRGEPAKKTDEVYRVASQDPPANTPLKPGMTVYLTLYGRMKTAEKEQLSDDQHSAQKVQPAGGATDGSSGGDYQQQRTAKLPGPGQ